MDATIKKQFDEMKAKHPETMLLFRNDQNDPATYDLYQEDAIYAAHILELETARPNSITAKLSFPHWALDVYLSKLVRAGRRVAICEQLEHKEFTPPHYKSLTAKEFGRHAGITTREAEQVLEEAAKEKERLEREIYSSKE